MTDGTVARGLWRDPAFRLLFLADAVSFAGSQITRVVLPILVFQLTGSALQTSLLLALQTTPYLVLGVFAGAIADRVNRRVLMVGFNALNGAILASIPLLSMLDLLTVTHVYVAALLSAVAWVWSDAANFGALPAIVGRARIVAASSILNAAWTIAGVVALPVGGLLAATIGPAVTLSLDAASFALAAIALACIRRPFGGVPVSDAAAPLGLVRRTLRDAAAGLRYVRRHELVGPLTALGFLSSLTTGAVLGLLVVYGVRELGLADDDPRLGWLYAAGAAGALCAALALPALVRRFSQPRISLVGFVASFACLLVLALSPSLAISLVALFAWEAAGTLVVINGIALRQQVTPDGLQSRVNATGRMLAAGGMPLGAVLGGVIADAGSVQTSYLVMAAGVGLSALFGWLSPLRSADRSTVARLMAAADEGRTIRCVGDDALRSPQRR